MAGIPLEDNFTDIIGKAQRGLKLDDAQTAARAGVQAAAVAAAKGGTIVPEDLRKIATALGLHPGALLDSANKSWYPTATEIAGLKQFNTPYEDMTVNSYLVWDPQSRQAAAFDTGADSSPMLEFARREGLSIQLILLTHTHPDHIADLTSLKQQTKASAFVSDAEPTAGAESFAAGRSFELGRLRIETRHTSGHSRGGITYVVSGLEKPVAVAGDALFAGSMGGGLVSYADALANNRKSIFTLPNETILCPGHGPQTTVGEEKQHNPFYPEFKQ